MSERQIILRKVRVHNLKSVDLTLKTNQLIVFTGVSGSGKSSLAFDTIYVEGQRRYIESLSTYARRHLGELHKPEAELISGISPTIAIEQKTAGRNPRSTVGTMTGIYDFMRVLYARVGRPHCPVSGEAVSPQSAQQILDHILQLKEGTKIILLAPYVKGKKGEFKDEFAELLRRGFTRLRFDGKWIEITEEIAVDGKIAHDIDLVVDRIAIKKEERGRIAESVAKGLELGKGVLVIFNADTQEETLYSQHAYSPKSGLSYGPLEPHDFSFNHPSGMCPTCQGMGNLLEFDLEKIIDPSKSIAQDCCLVGSPYETVRYKNIYDNLARIYDFSVDTPWKKLSEKAKKVFLYGADKKWIRMQFIHPLKKQRWVEFVQWRGILYEARKRYQEATSDMYRSKMEELMVQSICPDCKGAKIRPYPAATLLGGKRIHEVTAMPLRDSLHFFEKLRLTKQETIIAEELLKEIIQRFHFLQDVGLHYLTLDRTAPTLSGGESQRVRLASQIGTGLTQAIYILDEPSIGLHPRDNTKLLHSLKALRDKGNTVIVVEHDEETIRAADEIVDVGPLAGQNGGRIIVQGDLNALLKSPESITGAYLSGRLSIPIPKRRKPDPKKMLIIEKAEHHNLKKITVKIPLSLFIAVTGVSGSGKSSLISDILYPALSNLLHNAKLPVGKHQKIKGAEEIDKVIAIDQTPIGRTPRSNPATYIKLFDIIRDLFAELPESLAQGYRPGRFSFNVKEGSCPGCGGMGMVKIDMDFMEDEWVECEVCKGKRFDPKTLSVLYREKNIHDVLEMTVSEARDFFAAIPKIVEKLDTLLKVGLDYVRLGQPSPTLSGGEAQRIKLAKELSRASTGKTLYLLDEPTTGLHFHDIQKLIHVLQALVSRGNSVVVIEHNMDLVKTCDWIIDLGPEGGEEGGQLVAEGAPEKVAKMDTPTGHAVHAVLSSHAVTPSKEKHAHLPPITAISIEGASQNNLRHISAEIPLGKITLCTGPSGSGKTSFAFETVYAEGQRRYIESLSAYARQFVKQMPKPKVDRMEGLLAAIAIEQKNHAGNPRSTIGTMTETYDFLRLLYAHLGKAYDPETGEEIVSITKEFVLEKFLELPANTRVQILSPLSIKRHETFEQVKERLQKEGFLRIRLNGNYYELDQEIPYDRQRKNDLFLVIDRLAIGDSARKRLYDAIDQAANLSGGTLIAALPERDLFFNLSFAVASTGKSFPPITPHTFSFNTAHGMCPDCNGLGFQYGADLSRHREIMRLSAEGLVRLLWKENLSRGAIRLFFEFLDKEEIDASLPLLDLPPEKLQLLLNGAKEELPLKELRARWVGINAVFSKMAKASHRELKEEILALLDQTTCFSCKGSRLNPLARHVKVDELSIADLCALSVDESAAFIDRIKLAKVDHHFLEEPLLQLKHKLSFLRAIGLGYLSLDRSAPSLSGGETQRIRLARQLASGLTGCLYVLDEPTIGLHPHNNALLNRALKQLCSLGNTLLLVEHDPLTIGIADWIFDFGPGAGINGGKITAQGTLDQIKKNPHSLTGAYLSGKKRVPLPSTRRSSSHFIEVNNASLHNLKKLDVRFPLNTLTAITGVSGSGKSTLMNDLLKPAVQQALAGRTKKDRVTIAGATVHGIAQIDQLIAIDQNPIGQTIRADVSTYVDLLTPLRTFFAALPEAKARGLQPKHFSSNHRKGMCTGCWGLGTKTIEMQFLPPVKVICDVCHGLRLNPLSLQIKLRGKNLGELLQMTVEESKEWLPAIPKVTKIIETLLSVGLSYLRLGQEISSLSGGEAQRIRLSRELSKRSSGKTLYLFDEPTVGLHSDDIVKLLSIFHTLVDKGNSVILIEHNLDVIANADFVIDLGPDAGSKGGELIATGTPEQVAKNPSSYTAKYLKEHLTFLNASSKIKNKEVTHVAP